MCILILVGHSCDFGQEKKKTQTNPKLKTQATEWNALGLPFPPALGIWWSLIRVVSLEARQSVGALRPFFCGLGAETESFSSAALLGDPW